MASAAADEIATSKQRLEGNAPTGRSVQSQKQVTPAATSVADESRMRKAASQKDAGQQHVGVKGAGKRTRQETTEQAPPGQTAPSRRGKRRTAAEQLDDAQGSERESERGQKASRKAGQKAKDARAATSEGRAMGEAEFVASEGGSPRTETATAATVTGGKTGATTRKARSLRKRSAGNAIAATTEEEGKGLVLKSAAVHGDEANSQLPAAEGTIRDIEDLAGHHPRGVGRFAGAAKGSEVQEPACEGEARAARDEPLALQAVVKQEAEVSTRTRRAEVRDDQAHGDGEETKAQGGSAEREDSQALVRITVKEEEGVREGRGRTGAPMPASASAAHATAVRSTAALPAVAAVTAPTLSGQAAVPAAVKGEEGAASPASEEAGPGAPPRWSTVLERIKEMRRAVRAPVDTMGCEKAGEQLPDRVGGLQGGGVVRHGASGTFER